MDNLEQDLKQFYGSDIFYYLPSFPQYKYTEGIKYLLEKAGAYWLLGDFIFLKQAIPEIEAEAFQVWKIQVNQDDNSAVILLEDGNKNEVSRFRIPFTDFSLKECSLWFIGGTLLLPSEY